MKLPLVASTAPKSKPLVPFRGSTGYRFSVAPPVVEVANTVEPCDEDGHNWTGTGNVHGDMVCTVCGVEDEHWTLAAATSEDDRY